MRSAIVDVKDWLVSALIALKSVGEAFGLIGKWGDLEKEWIGVFWSRGWLMSGSTGMDFELSGIVDIIAIEIEVAG